MPELTPLADPFVGSVAVKLKLAPDPFDGFEGLELIATVGGVVSIRKITTFDAALAFPTESCAALAAIWNVKLPSLFGEVRLMVKKYGPTPDPVEAPGSQSIELGEVPPMIRSSVVELNPVTGSLNTAWQAMVVALDGPPSGVHESVTVGPAVSIVQESSPDALVEALPARSWTAPVAICSVRFPSAVGAPRLTKNVNGPAPDPARPEALHVVDVPPIVRSADDGLKPVTDSLKVAEQLKVVELVGDPAGTHVKLVTEGATRSIAHV